MRKIAVLSLFLCLVAVCRAQYIGSQYMNVKLGYIVDESQVQADCFTSDIGVVEEVTNGTRANKSNNS